MTLINANLLLVHLFITAKFYVFVFVYVYVLSNFIHQRVIEKNKQTKTVYNKHQNTIDMQDYQAVTCV